MNNKNYYKKYLKYKTKYLELKGGFPLNEDGEEEEEVVEEEVVDEEEEKKKEERKRCDAIYHKITALCKPLIDEGANADKTRKKIISELDSDEKKIYDDCEARKHTGSRKHKDSKAENPMSKDEEQEKDKKRRQKESKARDDQQKDIELRKAIEEYERKEEEKKVETEKILAKCAIINEKIDTQLKVLGANSFTKKKLLDTIKDKLPVCEKKFYNIYCSTKSTGARKAIDKRGASPVNVGPGNAELGNVRLVDEVPGKVGLVDEVPGNTGPTGNTENLDVLDMF